MISTLLLALPLLAPNLPATVALLAPAKAKTPSTVSIAPGTKKGTAIVVFNFEDKKGLGKDIGLTHGKQKLLAKDDGKYPDLVEGDGKYSVLTRVVGTETVSPGVAPFLDGEAKLEPGISVTIEFKFVACPADCTSILGGSCWICVEATGGSATVD